jgi:hypothetical protein
MGATIRVFRCPCGKMHCCAYASEISLCTCGRRLWPLIWAAGR